MFTAVLFSAFLCLRFFAGSIPLPKFVGEKIENEIQKYGLNCAFVSVSFSFDGTVEIVQPTVKVGNSPFPIFAAEKVRFGVDIFSLVCGAPELKFISIQKGRLSDSIGDIVHSPKVRDISLNLRSEGDWWVVNYLGLKAENLMVNARGILNEKFSPSELLSDADGIVDAVGGDGAKNERAQSLQADGDSALPLSQFVSKFDAAMAKISEYAQFLECFKEPSVNLEFAFFGGGVNWANVSFNAENCSFAFSQKDFDAGQLAINFNYSTLLHNSRTMRLTASAKQLGASDLPTCENVVLNADVFADNTSAWLENIEFLAAKIAWKGVYIDNVSLKKDFLSKDEFSKNWKLFAAFDKNRFGGIFSFNTDGLARFDFSANINPRKILNMKELADIRELEEFDFPNGVVFNGALYADIKNKSVKTRIQLESENCLLMNIPVRRVFANVDFDSQTGVMSATDISVKAAEGWNIDGEMIQNIKSLVYIIRVNGSIRPMAIAHFMEPWWTRVMKSFTFAGAGNFPYADMYVEGKWGEPERMWCFGSAQGANASYNGSQFDKFFLRIWVNPSRITLYDISLNASERQAHAFVEWLYGADGITRYVTQRLFIESNLNSSELIALGGEDAREVLDVVRFHNAPRLTLNAVLQNPFWKNGKLDQFNVEAFAKGKTQIETVSLQDLSFKARSDKINTNIYEASFEFCRGFADASIDLRRADGGMLFNGSAKAQNMGQVEFFDFLDKIDEPQNFDPSSVGSSAQSSGNDSKSIPSAPVIFENDEDESHPLLNSTRAKVATAKRDTNSGFMGENGEKGKVNINVDLSGDTRNFSDIKGEGFVVLSNRDLLELNIFGLLSRALSAVKLPFGSFDLTQFSGAFTIKSGVVSFPKLEIGGPVMRVRGSAAYNFIKDDLKANIAVIPFAGIQTPIISSLVSVINPIMNVATIKISGKLSDPKFGVSLNPMNFFDSEIKAIKKE